MFLSDRSVIFSSGVGCPFDPRRIAATLEGI
jgi:hypothetical protein